MDKTLLKGLTLLEALANQNGKPVTIQELADIVGWTRSNAHRTLQTLAYAGYAIRDESTGSYRSTFKLFELGSKQISTLDVRRFIVFVSSPVDQSLPKVELPRAKYKNARGYTRHS